MKLFAFTVFYTPEMESKSISFPVLRVIDCGLLRMKKLSGRFVLEINGKIPRKDVPIPGPERGNENFHSVSIDGVKNLEYSFLENTRIFFWYKRDRTKNEEWNGKGNRKKVETRTEGNVERNITK